MKLVTFPGGQKSREEMVRYTFWFNFLTLERTMEVNDFPLDFSDLFSNLTIKGFLQFALPSFSSNAWNTYSHVLLLMDMASFWHMLFILTYAPHIRIQKLFTEVSKYYNLIFSDKGVKAWTEKTQFSKEWAFTTPFNFTVKKHTPHLSTMPFKIFAKVT